MGCQARTTMETYLVKGGSFLLLLLVRVIVVGVMVLVVVGCTQNVVVEHPPFAAFNVHLRGQGQEPRSRWERYASYLLVPC